MSYKDSYNKSRQKHPDVHAAVVRYVQKRRDQIQILRDHLTST